MLVVMTCPNCSAQLQIDDSRQVFFCQFCGTKIVNVPQRIEMSGQVTIDRRGEIDNLIIRAMEFERNGDYSTAASYCSRILDIDPVNPVARSMQNRLDSYRVLPNVKILYTSDLADRMVLRVTLDGKSWHEINKNQSVELTLPVGKHRVMFSGTKVYTQEITVTDTRKRITVTYHASRRRNTINIT